MTALQSFNKHLSQHVLISKVMQFTNDRMRNFESVCKLLQPVEEKGDLGKVLVVLVLPDDFIPDDVEVQAPGKKSIHIFPVPVS